MAGVSAVFLAVPFATGGGFARRATTIDDIYRTLNNTEAGAFVISEAKRQGLPSASFKASRIAEHGAYHKFDHVLEINSAYSTLPPEVGAPILAHEFVHVALRGSWVNGSQAQEFIAHMIEAQIWQATRRRGTMPLFRLFNRSNYQLRHLDDILAKANSTNGIALWKHISETYSQLPRFSKSFSNDPIWSTFYQNKDIPYRPSVFEQFIIDD
jgi:hypothetical protein